MVLIEVPLSQKTSPEGPLPTPGLTPTLLRHGDFSYYTTNEVPATPKPHSGMENSMQYALLSSGLAISSEWSKAQLLIVPSNLPVQKIESIATTYVGKEVWVVGSADSWEKWRPIADRFDTLHLGNLIVSTTIRKLITAPQADTSDSSITPAMSRLFNSNIKSIPSVVPLPIVNRSPPSDAGIPHDPETPYIMVVDDNHIVSVLLG